MNKALKVILIIVFFAMLAGVRYFQEALFYDPLLPFFKSNFSLAALPDLIVPK
jgi:exosortase F-associated protein